MGLDFHIKVDGNRVPDPVPMPYWSYVGFRLFRKELAELVGIDLDKMRGFGGDLEWRTDDGIVPLLNHSDCDGDLSPIECARVAPRLRELAAHLNEPDDGYGPDERPAMLASAMEWCAANGGTLIFC